MSKVDKTKLIGVNIDAEPIRVRHQDLERASEDSPYKSVCPVCKEGILAIKRYGDTLEINSTDYCLLCGQTVIYTDLGALKALRGA